MSYVTFSDSVSYDNVTIDDIIEEKNFLKLYVFISNGILALFIILLVILQCRTFCLTQQRRKKTSVTTIEEGPCEVNTNYIQNLEINSKDFSNVGPTLIRPVGSFSEMDCVKINLTNSDEICLSSGCDYEEIITDLNNAGNSCPYYEEILIENKTVKSILLEKKNSIKSSLKKHLSQKSNRSIEINNVDNIEKQNSIRKSNSSLVSIENFDCEDSNQGVKSSNQNNTQESSDSLSISQQMLNDDDSPTFYEEIIEDKQTAFPV